MILLPENWKKHWQGRDHFDCVLAIQGDEYRNMDGRRTLRFDMLGKSYFAKIYTGVGWWRIISSILTLHKPPVLSACNEYLAVKKLTELGIDTMTCVGYGTRGRSPAHKQSFLITEDLVNSESLEDFCRNWPQQPPDCRLKRALIRKLANISRTMHGNGINHRDYYLCHFLLDVSAGKESLDLTALKPHLIDLHRVQFRTTVPRRWLVKDLASLYFSAMEIGLTRRDYLRFMCAYSAKPLRDVINDEKKLWLMVDRRAQYLLQRYYRKYAS